MNKTEIDYIQNRATERITEIFDALSIEYTERHDYLQCACPIHEGDNPRALYWAIQTAHWKCTTRHCEEESITGPSSSVFGLVRGIMSQRQNSPWTFNQAVMFVAKVLNLGELQIDRQTAEDIEMEKVIRQHKQKQKEKNKSEKLVLLADVLPKLQSDTIYYPKRGINSETINKYHISYCGRKGKSFYKRAFFPVLDETGRHVVGWSARSIYNKCNKCQMHHHIKIQCPDADHRHIYTKWKHSPGFKAEQCLYNYWYAKPFISKTATAIVCESPGNCWAFDAAGIPNSVAMFGLSISKAQRIMLQRAGALTLIFALDNDQPGQNAVNRLKDKLNQYFRLFFISPDGVNDIGDMKLEDIKNQIGPVLQYASREKLLSDK